MSQGLDFHKPVMIKEVIKALSPKDYEVYLDCTFGAGGYANQILSSSNCKLFAIDRDENVKEFAKATKLSFKERFIFLQGRFSQAPELLAEYEDIKFDGIVLDLGVSSMQLDEKNRGFSFDSEAKLDMRMDQEASISAFEVINQLEEEELARIIKDYGDEPKSRNIARKIVKIRTEKEIFSCKDLAKIVHSCYYGYFKTDPATKTFQAIRIYVNQELEELEEALTNSIKLLKKGGRLVVVSFHSLEDRIVKKFLRDQAGIESNSSRYLPQIIRTKEINFHLEEKSAIAPSEEEIEKNPRSRSAKMRYAIRV